LHAAFIAPIVITFHARHEAAHMLEISIALIAVETVPPLGQTVLHLMPGRAENDIRLWGCRWRCWSLWRGTPVVVIPLIPTSLAKDHTAVLARPVRLTSRAVDWQVGTQSKDAAQVAAATPPLTVAAAKPASSIARLGVPFVGNGARAPCQVHGIAERMEDLIVGRWWESKPSLPMERGVLRLEMGLLALVCIDGLDHALLNQQLAKTRTIPALGVSRPRKTRKGASFTIVYYK
jgi:hypothetical protein